MYECVMAMRGHEGKGCILADEMYVLKWLVLVSLTLTSVTGAWGKHSRQVSYLLQHLKILTVLQTITLVWTLLSWYQRDESADSQLTLLSRTESLCQHRADGWESDDRVPCVAYKRKFIVLAAMSAVHVIMCRIGRANSTSGMKRPYSWFTITADVVTLEGWVETDWAYSQVTRISLPSSSSSIRE